LDTVVAAVGTTVYGLYIL